MLQQQFNISTRQHSVYWIDIFHYISFYYYYSHNIIIPKESLFYYYSYHSADVETATLAFFFAGLPLLLAPLLLEEAPEPAGRGVSSSW